MCVQPPEPLIISTFFIIFDISFSFSIIFFLSISSFHFFALSSLIAFLSPRAA